MECIASLGLIAVLKNQHHSWSVYAFAYLGFVCALSIIWVLGLLCVS